MAESAGADDRPATAQDVHDLCLALPEVELGTSWGDRPTYLVRGKGFLLYRAPHRTAVDPATDVRIQRALDGVTRGRTSVTIAHRLSTAEQADDVLVFDAGRLVERGRHAELLALDGVYARLHASWRGSLR